MTEVQTSHRSSKILSPLTLFTQNLRSIHVNTATNLGAEFSLGRGAGRVSAELLSLQHVFFAALQGGSPQVIIVLEEQLNPNPNSSMTVARRSGIASAGA